MKIGVFDSGKGGLSVAKAIMDALPGHDVVFVDDAQHLPYGSRTPDDLLGLVMPILLKMQYDGCQVIVVACNTVTTTLIHVLRRRLIVPLVAVEPMVKPAVALSKTKTIAVCATPATLSSGRYAELKRLYAKGVKVIEPDCSNWAEMIEHNRINRQQIATTVKQVIEGGADVIVLGCTHYHWIEQDIARMVDAKAAVIQPEQAIVGRLSQVMNELDDVNKFKTPKTSRQL